MPSLGGILWNKKRKKSLKTLVRNQIQSFKSSSANIEDEEPTSHIIHAFKEYINNEIPSRLIDTSNLQFVSRRDVFRVFQDKIASVTDEQIQERIRRLHSDPLATYQPQRDSVLRQIIQEIVKYDILSHRWDEIAGEPTYEDVSAGKRQASKFNKLVQFCKTSRKLGRKLAWVDTCCIDKTNAAELSEAIHGMYKWYANSHLCIVHLAESTSYADWDSESWFTRGWTLQELLAPRRLKFYDKNWRPFTSSTIDDDRKSVDEIHPLESITGISKAVLTADNSQGVQGRSLWEVMSWASKRQTTLVEDRAYCLFGFFRVSLTIAYGEGQRAFSRLIEAVAAKNPSWDIFAWFGQPSVDHFALPSSPASYPAFEVDMGKNRVGVQKFTITAHGLSLKSLPPIQMEFCSVVQPEVPRKPFLVSLKPRSNNESCSGRYGDLVVECGATRFITIRDARQLSACIINHHAARNREQGKLMVGKEYICFLLYLEVDEDDEVMWMKLTTDNLLRISCLGKHETANSDMVMRASDSTGREAGIAEPDGVVSSLVTTVIRSPTPSK